MVPSHGSNHAGRNREATASAEPKPTHSNGKSAKPCAEQRAQQNDANSLPKASKEPLLNPVLGGTYFAFYLFGCSFLA